MNEFAAELVEALDKKRPGDPMRGRPQYLAQQIIKTSGLKGAYRLPLNAGKMRSMLKSVDELAAIRFAASPPLPVVQPGDGGTGECQGHESVETDFAVERRREVIARDWQRRIGNKWLRGSEWRSLYIPCRCGREHVAVEVCHKGVVDTRCPVTMWGRLSLSFPKEFPPTEDGMMRFLSFADEWGPVKERQSG